MRWGISTSEPEIRAARPDDLPRIAVLHLASWRVAYAGTFGPEALDGPIGAALRAKWAALPGADLVLVAAAPCGDGLAGFIAIRPDDPALIDSLHVAPGETGRGVGRALFVAASARLVREGREAAELLVFERNDRARRFYEGLGGRVVGRETQEVFGFAVPSLRMRWDALPSGEGVTDARGEP